MTVGSVSDLSPSPFKLPDDQVRKVLTNDYSTLRFRIEYGAFYSNHLLHAVVALHELGADKQTIAEYAAHYTKKLVEENSDHEDVVELSESSKLLTDEEARDLVGKRRDYDALLAYYAHDVKTLGVDGAVSKHLPHLYNGLAGALLHGLIQLGYAYHISGDRLVAEGLAYQHHCYLSFEEPPMQPSEQPLRKLTRSEAFQVVDQVTSSEFLLSEQDQLMSTSPIKDLDIGWIQRGVNAFSGHPERGSSTAFKLIWEKINEFDFSNFTGSHALDLIMWLYMMVKHNDFTVLHAVTSAWSLQQIEHLLSATDRAKAWRVWLHVCLSAVVTARVRDYHEKDLCEPTSTLEERLAALPSWSELREKVLALPGFPDEHVYKMVQVADNHAQANYDEKDPVLSKVEREFVARTAAVKVTDEPFKPYAEQPK